MKSNIFEISLAEISFILLFFLLTIISINSAKTQKKEKNSSIPPPCDNILFTVKIIGYNKFRIKGKVYNIWQIEKKYNGIIKKAKKINKIQPIIYSYKESISVKDLKNSESLLRRKFYIYSKRGWEYYINHKKNHNGNFN